MVKYKQAKKNAKRDISEAWGGAYDGPYARLGTKGGENGIYKKGEMREEDKGPQPS
jgi:hypothetical protein